MFSAETQSQNVQEFVFIFSHVFKQFLGHKLSIFLNVCYLEKEIKAKAKIIFERWFMQRTTNIFIEVLEHT